MANYGLTKYGFVAKRFDTILQELRDLVLVEFPDAAIGDDQTIGHLLDVFSKELAEVWELAEAVYKSRAPSSADGTQLDDIGQINAIPRDKARQAVVYESFQGANGTLIDTTFRFKRLEQDELFLPDFDASIDNTSTSQSLCKVLNIINNHVYTLTINNNTIDYTSDGTATIEEIAAGMVGVINAQTEFLGVNASEDDYSIGTFFIRANDGSTAYTLVLSADFNLEKFWTPIRCLSETKGDIDAPAGTLDQIVTPVPGLTAVINFADAVLGSEIQEDPGYRVKLFTETRRLGGGSLEAIKDRVLNEVNDVVLTKGFENDTSVIDGEGRPPKSIEMLVEGGDDTEIAEKIWETKSGGILTDGDESIPITDSQGDTRLIKFSRPTSQYVHFDITLTTGASFPTNGVDTIKEDIVLLGRNKFTIGDLLLIQEFYTPIYAVEGVTNAVIQWDVTDNPGDTPTYVSTNIQLGQKQSPLFDEVRILITVV